MNNHVKVLFFFLGCISMSSEHCVENFGRMNLRVDLRFFQLIRRRKEERI